MNYGLGRVRCVEAAARGDTAAVETVHTIAARFARGLAPVLLVLDPDLVVIGAGVSRAGSALLQAIEASWSR